MRARTDALINIDMSSDAVVLHARALVDGTFLVATTYLADGRDGSRSAPELHKEAAGVFPA